MTVAADSVHIIPPDATLTIAKGILHVEARPHPATAVSPIDTFFESLAEDQEENAARSFCPASASDGSLASK